MSQNSDRTAEEEGKKEEPKNQSDTDPSSLVIPGLLNGLKNSSFLFIQNDCFTLSGKSIVARFESMFFALSITYTH